MEKRARSPSDFSTSRTICARSFTSTSAATLAAASVAVAQSPRAPEVYVAPGNAGTALEPRVRNVDIAAEDVDALVAFARRERIDLTIVGPEAPLVIGVTDAFEAAGLRCFGPRKLAARLEGSKAFTKAS